MTNIAACIFGFGVVWENGSDLHVMESPPEPLATGPVLHEVGMRGVAGKLRVVKGVGGDRGVMGKA
jgi:hypothetical protein